MRISDEYELKSESFLDMLNKQYSEFANKEKIDYWTPLTKIIMESIEIRDLKQMSQADLAEKMKTRQSVISRFENMGRLPNYDFISRLSFALGHKPGMTLYGDYMAVVPNNKQDIIKKMADKEKMSTENFVQNLLEQSINRISSSPFKLKTIDATSEIIIDIQQQEDRTILSSSASSTTTIPVAMAS